MQLSCQAADGPKGERLAKEGHFLNQRKADLLKMYAECRFGNILPKELEPKRNDRRGKSIPAFKVPFDLLEIRSFRRF